MKVPLLHVIATDLVAEARTFEATAASLIAAGRDRIALHLRLRRAGGRDFFGLARRLGRAAADAGAWCVINGRVDVALTAGAQAVQLGSGALPVDAVRRLAGTRLPIGASVHSAGDAGQRAAEGADFLVVGSVFPTATHPDRIPGGLGLVTACTVAGVPVVGIGGIDADSGRQVIEAGAVGIAVVRAVWQAKDPVDAALGLIDVVAEPAHEGEDDRRMLRVEVNGKDREVNDGRTVAGLLEDLDLDGRLVVVELNRQIIRRTEIEHVALRDGDRVEIVHFVGGG